jgi:ubiquinol-cytochrome c reductase cytochrome b subunit
MLGGLAQINPVWLYGPYVATTASSPAQPDWYIGWLEGIMRIAPPMDIVVFGHRIPGVFFVGVLLPGLAFIIIFLWPFIEQRFTRDTETHHLLNRGRDLPARTGIGAGGLTFFVLLTVAGSNDVLARFFGVPVELITDAFRIVLIPLPIAAGLAVYAVCRELHDRGDERPAGPWVWLRRTPEGGFEEVEVPDAKPPHTIGAPRSIDGTHGSGDG